MRGRFGQSCCAHDVDTSLPMASTTSHLTRVSPQRPQCGRRACHRRQSLARRCIGTQSSRGLASVHGRRPASLAPASLTPAPLAPPRDPACHQGIGPGSEATSGASGAMGQRWGASRDLDRAGARDGVSPCHLARCPRRPATGGHAGAWEMHQDERWLQSCAVTVLGVRMSSILQHSIPQHAYPAFLRRRC